MIADKLSEDYPFNDVEVFKSEQFIVNIKEDIYLNLNIITNKTIKTH